MSRDISEERVDGELQIGVLADVKPLRVGRQLDRFGSQMLDHELSQRAGPRWQRLTEPIEKALERASNPAASRSSSPRRL